MPLLGLTALIAALGHRLGKYIPVELWLLPAITALILFLALQIFKQVPRLNLVLLLGLALLAGAVLNWLDLSGRTWFAWIALILGLALSLVWGYLLGIRLGWFGILLFPITIAYLIGWFLISLLPEFAQLSVGWAVVGLFVFLGLAIHTVTEARFSEAGDTPVPLVSDLFIVYFNLFWIGALIEAMTLTTNS